MADILGDILRLQEEIRVLEQQVILDDQEQPEQGVFHRAISNEGDPTEVRRNEYIDTSPASIPAGTLVVQGPAGIAGEQPWGDHPRNAEMLPGFERVPCANQAGCLDDNFCYSDYDCSECEACYGNTCRDIDVFAPCFPNDKRPCPPSPEQRYDCLDPVWRWWDECTFNNQTLEFDCHEPDGSSNWHLTCRTNDDCDSGEVCDNRHFYCVPACTLDAQCDPGHPQRAGDAQSGSFCVSGECITPCEPPRFCTPQTEATDCSGNEYCAERQGRTATDPEGIRSAYQCEPGCRDICPDYRDETGRLWPVQCVDHACVRTCSTSSDCIVAEGEGCVEGQCQPVGQVCLADSDCTADKYCNSDGRCVSGCRSSASCEPAECGKDQSCVDACPADPTCTCTCPNGEESCAECPADFSWLDNCPRDPDCVRQCGQDKQCLADRIEGATCVDGTCAKVCELESDCPNGWGCVDNKCQKATTDEEKRIECKDVEICGDIIGEDGNPTGEKGCYFEEQCTEIVITPEIPSGIYDCVCGELCTQEGQCSPALCNGDADCESCSYCGPDGVCIPGCDSENVCPEGECCGTDSKCHNICSTDSDCPDPEVCLTGGCCGLACDPIIICSQSSGCPSGMFCLKGICESGCSADSDCESDEVCRDQSCTLACATDADCGDDPLDICVNGGCDRAQAPGCQNDNDCADGICKDGKCGIGCRTDDQCEGKKTCIDGQCRQPCVSYEECYALEEGNVCLDGYCKTVNAGPTGDGHDGCECFETCDEMGRCVAQPCNSSSDCGCGDCLTNSLCGVCQADNDCPGAARCMHGECLFPCIPESPCEDNTDCPEGFYCDERTRACLNGCQADSNCLPGEVCRDNTCVFACSDDSECDTQTELCIGGGCVYRGYVCVTEADCPSGLGACINGYCAEDQRCGLTDDCPDGKVCDDGFCVSRSTCSGQADCKSNEFCIDGLCSAESLCTTSANCDAGKVCHDNRCKEGKLCAADWQCGEDKYCNNGLCQDDTRCLVDADCPIGEFCAQGFCVFPPNKDQPPQVGCESCNEYCASDFFCRPLGCASNEECCDGAGICGADGTCKDECTEDADCGEGVCDGGECIECKVDADCFSIYGDARMVCNDGVCDTPCFTGLSDGDCFEGLRLGDMCENCPESCPGGAAQCLQSVRSFGTTEIYDKVTGSTRYRAKSALVCKQTCTTGSDCGEGYACFAGECITSNGMCDSDNDCGDSGYCQNFECKEPEGNCFANSDCEAGTACVNGECRQVDPDAFEEGGNLVCPRGKVQRNGQCFMACDAPFMYCILSAGDGGSESIPCPEGYTCNSEINRCVRNGYYGEEDMMGCAFGEFCCEGACVPYRPFYRECCGDQDCEGDKRCVSPSAADPGMAVCRDVGWEGTVEDLAVEASQDLKSQRDAARAAHAETVLAWNQAKAAYDAAFALPEADLSRPQQIAEAEIALEEAEAARAAAAAPLQQLESMWNEFANQPYLPEGSADSGGGAGGGGGGAGGGGGQPQDTCAPKGLCCQDNGFCGPCECGEDNPCPNGECCNPETGECVTYEDHHETRFGAPGKCSYGDVYCEVKDCEGNPFSPSTEFDGPGYEWCEDVVTGQRRVAQSRPHAYLADVTITEYVFEDIVERKCHPGGEASDEQVIRLLQQFCDCPDEDDECKCPEELEGAEECGNDFDCAQCQRCVTRYLRSDPCCGRSYTVDGVEYDGVVQSVCEAIHQEGSQGYESECQCESDSDCTDCEKCIGRNSGGDWKYFCEPQCEELCACGGETTNGEGCPTCEEKYGGCADEAEGETIPAYVDETTGELIPARTTCNCYIKTESDCCEAFLQEICEIDDFTGKTTCRQQTLDDIKKHRDGCIYKTRTDSNGTTKVLQVDYCVDFDEGICAECLTDAHCQANSICRNYQCITQCGQVDSQGGGGKTVDAFLPAQDCTCCTDQGECKSLHESWSESREVAGPPDENGKPTQAADCRPCQCTADGIDCQAYASCESCYKWVRADGSADEADDNYGALDDAALQAKNMQISQKISDLEIKKEDIEERYGFAQQEYFDALATFNELDSQLAASTCNPENLTSSCRDLISRHAQAQSELSSAQSTRDSMLNEIDFVEEQIALLHLELEGTFKSGEWIRERQCDCCIDGQCRPESDCTYGTCYICIDDSDEEALKEMKFYRGAVYNKVKAEISGIWQLTCMGLVPEHYDEEMIPNDLGDKEVGSNVFYFDFDRDNCVVYSCKDGIATQQVGGTIGNTRHYEYCTGSIISCALSGSTPEKREQIKAEYKQGWDFEIDQTGAGVYLGNFRNGSEVTDWVRMSWPEEEVINTGCYYPNPNAHVRSHTLPTFVDLVYTHECCSKSLFIYECDPEHPNCNLQFMDYYESGDPAEEIRRLERDIAILNQYLGQIEAFISELEALKAAKEEERDRLEEKWNNETDYCNDIFDRIRALEQEIEDTEEKLKEDEQNIKGKDGDEGTEAGVSHNTVECEPSESVPYRMYCDVVHRAGEYTKKSGATISESGESAVDKAEAQYNLIKPERDRLMDQRDGYQDEIQVVQQAHALAIENRDSAGESAVSHRAVDMQNTARVIELSQEIANLTPGTVEYDNAVFLRDEAQAAADEAAALAEAAQDAYESFKEEAEELAEELELLQDYINLIQEKLQNEQNQLDRANEEWHEARVALLDLKDVYFNTQTELLNKNAELEGLMQTKFECEDKIDITTCDILEGHILVNCETEENDYHKQRDILNELIEDVDALITELGPCEGGGTGCGSEHDKVSEEIKRKTDEVKKLEESREDIVPNSTSRPETGETIKTSEQLRELYKEMKEEEEEELEKEWWPGA